MSGWGFEFGDLFGGALGDDFSAVLAGLGADVEDPVGFGGDDHVVLDDDDGVAFIDEAVKDVDEALHEWIKIEAGHFEYAMTPNGVTKKALSINFNAMDQDQFNDFYKAAFNVCWRFILSRTFEDERQADNAISQILAFG